MSHVNAKVNEFRGDYRVPVIKSYVSRRFLGYIKLYGGPC